MIHENAGDGCYPTGSKTSCSIGSTTPQVPKKTLPDNPPTRTPFSNGSPASTARKRSPLGSNENKTGPAMFRKLDRKKPSDLKVETVVHNGSSGTTILDNSPLNKIERVSAMGKQCEKPEIKRALFADYNEKQKLGLFKVGSRVVPFGDASVVVSNETGDICRNQRDCDELSLIRKQLLQIENQQSKLLDVLQRFIGSSQNGMHSLEARVNGLKLALDEISFDLAVSIGRMSQNSAAEAMCCKLPGTEFLSSKLWRKAASMLPASGGTPSMAAFHSITDKIGASEGFPVENTRFLLQGGREVIVNPLAKLSNGSRGLSQVSSSGVVNNISV